MSFKHKKKFGQNFLTDQREVLRKIMEVSNVQAEDTVLEIGPGEGALTALLLDTAKKVVTVEIDRDLEKILRKKFDGNPKYTLVMNDVLETDLRAYVGAGTKVVANIPYYITSPIINKLIENRDVIDEIYIMVQKEVAERVCAKKGKERSVLTLAVEYYGEAEYLFTIPKEFFTPIPKVDSAFMSIKLYKDNRYINQVDEDTFFKYVKAGFSNKRKNLLNNFSTLGYSKDELRVILAKAEIPETERAEITFFVILEFLYRRFGGTMLSSYEFLIQSRKEDIDFINKVIEAYEGIGVVRTVDANAGIVNVISTDDFKDFVRTIIEDLDKNYGVEAKITEEGPWKGSLYINKK